MLIAAGGKFATPLAKGGDEVSEDTFVGGVRFGCRSLPGHGGLAGENEL